MIASRQIRRGLPMLGILLALAGCQGNFDSSSQQIEQPPQPTSAAPPVATLGGQSYTVVAGDTIDSIARQYGVPVDVLIHANNLASPYQLHAGQQLVVPTSGVYVVQPGDSLYRIAMKHNTTVAAIAQVNGIAPPYRILVGQHLTLPGMAVASNGTGIGDVQTGDVMPPSTAAAPLQPAGSSVVTTESLAPPPGVSAAPAPASTVSGSSATGMSVGNSGSSAVTSETMPTLAPVNPTAPPSSAVTSTTITTGSTGTMTTGSGGSQVKPVPPATSGAIPLIPPVSTQPGNSGTGSTGTAASTAGSQESVSQTVTNQTGASQVTTGSGAAAGSQTASAQPGATATQPAAHGNGKFLWPVNGKIISPFGVKDGGQHNDGINIAAPLGTPVHAADTGVVVYAGNELRGFGNLLLIRHDNGWVSAYAHCDALLVKRGDTVKRGQVIARVGQSGNVNAPQLHFELRKGAEAVDPIGQLGPQGA